MNKNINEFSQSTTAHYLWATPWKAQLTLTVLLSRSAVSILQRYIAKTQHAQTHTTPAHLDTLTYPQTQKYIRTAQTQTQTLPYLNHEALRRIFLGQLQEQRVAQVVDVVARPQLGDACGQHGHTRTHRSRASCSAG